MHRGALLFVGWRAAIANWLRYEGHRPSATSLPRFRRTMARNDTGEDHRWLCPFSRLGVVDEAMCRPSAVFIYLGIISPMVYISPCVLRHNRASFIRHRSRVRFDQLLTALPPWCSGSKIHHLAEWLSPQLLLLLMLLLLLLRLMVLVLLMLLFQYQGTRYVYMP